jgi:putative ABC transport system permease protein
MKEIAIRKVLSAKGEQLMVTLSKPFFYIILLANLIAWPVSSMVVNKWLESFAYRVPLYQECLLRQHLNSFVIRIEAQ